MYVTKHMLRTQDTRKRTELGDGTGGITWMSCKVMVTSWSISGVMPLNLQ